MWFNTLITNIVANHENLEGIYYLEQVQNTYNYLNNIEKQTYDYILNFYKQYKSIPTEHEFLAANDKHKIIYINTEPAKKSNIENVVKEYYVEVNKRILNQVINDAHIALGSDKQIDLDSIIKRLDETPKPPLKKIPILSERIASSDIFEGIDDTDAYFTGFFDEELYGFKNGKVYGIFAQTGVGKSNVSIFLAVNRFIQGKKVLYITLENSVEETWKKVSATLGSFNTKRFNSKKGTIEASYLKQKQDAVVEKMRMIEKFGGKLDILNANDLEIPDIKTYLMKEFKDTGKHYEFVVVDALYKAIHPTLTGWQKDDYYINLLERFCIGDANIGLPAFKLLFTSQLDQKADSDSLDLSNISMTQSYARNPSGIILLSRNPTINNALTATLAKNRDGEFGNRAIFKMNWTENTLYKLDDPDTQNFKSLLSPIAYPEAFQNEEPL